MNCLKCKQDQDLSEGKAVKAQILFHTCGIEDCKEDWVDEDDLLSPEDSQAYLDALFNSPKKTNK